MSCKIQLLDQSKLQETIDVCVGCFDEEWRGMADDNFLASLNDGGDVVGMVMVTTVFLTHCDNPLMVKYLSK